MIPTWLASASRFSPGSLFLSGEQGFWLDPSDFSTMFQDTAGTIPVTATGQSVALIRDKSGLGNHAVQATVASQPTLQIDGAGKYYLAFDGVDDGISIPSLSLVNSDKVTFTIGVQKESDAATAVIGELGTGSTGAFSLFGPNPAGNNFTAGSKGTVSNTSTTATGYVSPYLAVISVTVDIGNDLRYLRINTTQFGGTTGDQGTGNFSVLPFNFGKRSTTLLFTGRIYGAVVRGGISDSNTVTNLENWMNGKTGAF